MSKHFLLMTFTGLLLAGCAGSSAPKPDWEVAPDADIPALATFYWADDISASPNTIMETQISNAVRNELASRGYTESSQTPDFLVSYETLEREKVKQGNPVRLGIGVGSWGGSTGGSVGTSVDVGGDDEVLYENQLVVRALDSENRKELWIGTTTTFDQHPDGAMIEGVVAGVMQGFPARVQ